MHVQGSVCVCVYVPVCNVCVVSKCIYVVDVCVVVYVFCVCACVQCEHNFKKSLMMFYFNIVLFQI